MKKCPKCGNQTFHANAHIVQGWLVDSEGEFVAVSEECVEVTHSPKDDDVWACTKCNYEAAGSEFEAKELDPEEELNNLKSDQRAYFALTGGFNELRESDDKYNDFNRKIIEKFKESFGSAYLGTINFYGDKRLQVESGEKSIYEEYSGQNVYNFGCDFIVPCKDEILESYVREWNSNTLNKGVVTVNKIFSRVEELKGINFIWF